MRHSLTILTMIVTSIILLNGCKKAKYEFVNKNQVELETPNNLTDGDETPPPRPSSPHEFYGESGFWIKVHPGTVELGKKVRFTGNCGPENSGTINWKFGDGQSGRGADISYGYRSIGTYDVDAICTLPDGTTQEGQLKVIVVRPTNIGGTPIVVDTPGQHPGQTPVGSCVIVGQRQC